MAVILCRLLSAASLPQQPVAKVLVGLPSTVEAGLNSSSHCPEVLPSPVWSAGSASTGLHLSADKTGCFTVSADGKPWLVSGTTSISVNLIQRSNLNGTLSLVDVTTSHVCCNICNGCGANCRL